MIPGPRIGAEPIVASPGRRGILALAPCLSMALHAVALATLVDWRFADATSPDAYPVTIVFVEAIPAEAPPGKAMAKAEPAAPPPPTAEELVAPISPPPEEPASPPDAMERPAPETTPEETVAEETVAEETVAEETVAEETVAEATGEVAPLAPRPPAKPEREAPASQMAALSPASTGAGVAPSPVTGEPVTIPASFGAAGLNNPTPDYPPAARRRGWEGRVVLHALVSAEGRPIRISVAESSGREILDREAVETVRRWRFIPGERLGRPVESTVRVPVNFRLTSD